MKESNKSSTPTVKYNVRVKKPQGVPNKTIRVKTLPQPQVAQPVVTEPMPYIAPQPQMAPPVEVVPVVPYIPPLPQEVAQPVIAEPMPYIPPQPQMAPPVEVVPYIPPQPQVIPQSTVEEPPSNTDDPKNTVLSLYYGPPKKFLARNIRAIIFTLLFVACVFVGGMILNGEILIYRDYAGSLSVNFDNIFYNIRRGGLR